MGGTPLLFGGAVRDEVNEAKTIHLPDVAINAFLIARIWSTSRRNALVSAATTASGIM